MHGKKWDSTIGCLPDTQFRSKDTNSLKVKDQKKISHANNKYKKSGIALIKAVRRDYKSKSVTRDKGQYTMIKR